MKTKVNKLMTKLWVVFVFITVFSFNLAYPQEGKLKSCSTKAVNLLKKYSKNGYTIVTKVNDLSFFSFWLDCNNPPLYDIPSAVHETDHKLSSNLTDLSEGMYGYYLDNEEILKVKMKNLFYRSEVAEYLDNQDKQYSYYKLYLTDESGEQDFLVLLDELNAYTHGLKTAVQFINVTPKNAIYSARDGVATFMYYTELYLRKARLSYSEQWEQIYSDNEYLNLINSLWKRAENILKAALKYPQLGMYDEAVIKKVYNKKNISELKQTFSKGEQQFSYDTKILTMANNLKQGVPTSEKENIKNNTKKQTSTKTTININGKNMGLKEFEAYLKEHTELENLPQIQAILKKMRAEEEK